MEKMLDGFGLQSFTMVRYIMGQKIEGVLKMQTQARTKVCPGDDYRLLASSWSSMQLVG